MGWSWAIGLARLGHHVSVITRSANRAAIEQDPQGARDDLRFIYFDLPLWAGRWRKYPGGKLLYYVLWQFFAARYLRRLFPRLPFDVVHHVTYVSTRYPSFMGSLGIPFWFGPVSGGEGVPLRLRAGFSTGQRRRERLRDISNSLVRMDPLMRHTFRQAEKILVTRDTLGLVPRRWRHKCTVRLAIGLSEQYAGRNRCTTKVRPHGLQLLYVGRLLEWKGIDIALRAVNLFSRSHPDVRFTIVGDGPAELLLAKLSRELGLEGIVHWFPRLPQAQLAEYYRAADVLLFPSLRDSGGMVVLEALAHGLPVLCTDLGGPGLIVNASCGRALPVVERTPDQLCIELAGTLLEFATAPNLLNTLAEGATARARQFDFQDLVRSIYPAPSAEEMVRQA